MTTSKSTPEATPEQSTGGPVEPSEAAPAAALLVRLIERGPQTIGELAESSELARPTVSHHLKLLEQVGLVSMTKVATRRICTASTGRAVSLLRELLNTIECDMEAAERCLQAREAATGK